MKIDDSAATSSSLEIKVFSSPAEATDDDLRGCSVVVIDVLRSSATIATAISNGAREVIPVLSPAEAGKLAGRGERGISLLCGEREGRKIDGFDLGNSPFEYTTDRVAGRILIFASTNGAGAILRARVAEKIYVGGFNNFGAMVKRLVQDKNPVAIVCAGKVNQFSLEDFVCAGKFVNALETKVKRGVLLNDAARAAGLLHRHFDGTMAAVLRSSQHGKYLASIGFEDDIDYCARIDSHPVIPMFVEGKVKGYKPDGSPLGEPANLSN